VSNRSISRRQFLVQTSSASFVLVVNKNQQALADVHARELLSSGNSAPSEMAALKELFLKPAFSTRPMTRWWWFGGAVAPEEITRELTMMRDAGLRGVELQPVYPVEVDDPERGIQNTRYFSPEWFQLLRHTVIEAQRLGMQLDFTLASGWPFGGPFIPIRLAARKLQMLAQDATGPRRLGWPYGTVLPDNSLVLATVLAPILPSAEIDLNKVRVISRGPLERVEIPAGEWKVMTFADCPTLMQVKRPTIGMEGNVLDHFNREALDFYLDAVGQRTFDELKGVASPPFHSVFCDSLEVEGADWTADFLKEFRDRRGYDLIPFLPALWGDAGPLTPHIRYDYHLTLSELILNNFFGPLAEWSERHGVTARVQAHGAMGDVMQAYGTAHIPEGEHIGEGGDRYLVDNAHRRLASSAGHIYQKAIISAETYTWLRRPLFMVTLEMMKAATDAQFLDGINQIINHGYPYSPPQAGRPGWTFYASTVINHNNIWWRHYPELAAYIQRTAGILIQGVAVNAVAVYLPLPDVYAKFGAGGLHMDEALENYVGAALVLGLRRAGYDFDFINDHALQKIAKVENGRLAAGAAVYSGIIVPQAQYMPVESLHRLSEFVQSGGTLIFVKQVPGAEPGFLEQESRTRQLRSLIAGLWGGTVQRQNQARTSGRGNVYLASDLENALKHLKERIIPDFRIVEAGDNSQGALKSAKENVGFVHRRGGDVDFYFISNMSRHRLDLRVEFAVGHRTPQRWNPETAAIEDTLVYEFVDLASGKGSVTAVQIGLEPFESRFMVFSSVKSSPLVTRTNWPGILKVEHVDGGTQVTGLLPRNDDYYLISAQGKAHHFSVADLPDSQMISGPWRLTLGDQRSLTLERLVSWNEFPEGKTFSGWGIYETSFELNDPGKNLEWMLDLGAVRETAEATLNGLSLGAAWKGLRQLSCRDALKVGTNALRVEVGNLWINHVESLPNRDLKKLAQTYGIRWGTDEENVRPPTPPAGLLGPVRLVPLKRWTERF